MKKEKYFGRIARESRKVKWSTPAKTKKSFIYTMITILLFMAVVVLFSWGISELFKVLGA